MLIIDVCIKFQQDFLVFNIQAKRGSAGFILVLVSCDVDNSVIFILCETCNFIDCARTFRTTLKSIDVFELLIGHKEEELVFDDWTTNIKAISFSLKCRNSDTVTVKAVTAEIVISVVIEETAIPYPLCEHPSFSHLLGELGITPRVEVRSVQVRRGSDLELTKLKLRENSKVIEVRRNGFAEAMPLSQSKHVFPASRLPRASLETPAWRSITRVLRENGIAHFRRLVTQISTRLPTATERESLALPRHVPVLITESLNVDERGWPVELGEAMLASDRVALELRNGPQRIQSGA